MLSLPGCCPCSFSHPFHFSFPSVCSDRLSDRQCNITSEEPFLILWDLSVLPECSIVPYIYYDRSNIIAYVVIRLPNWLGSPMRGVWCVYCCISNPA